MDKKSLVSYSLATLAGICFIGGFFILSNEGRQSMYRLEGIISLLDEALDTRRKRHIIGGILMSVSFLFGGLAITVVTLKTEVDNNEQ